MIADARQVYDRPDAGPVYAAARGLSDETMRVWSNALKAALPANHPAIRNVLDLGCGTGRFTALLADTFSAEVVGIEPAASMLSTAQAGVRDPRCRFAVGAGEALPLADASVDLVLLSMVYHHIRDWPRTHAELRRVLREEGIVMIRTPVKDRAGSPLLTRFFPAASEIGTRTLPATDEITEAFTEAGYRLVAHRTVRQRVVDSSAEYVRRIEQRGISSLQLMPDDAFAEGLAHLRTYLENTDAETLQRARVFEEQLELFCFQIQVRNEDGGARQP